MFSVKSGCISSCRPGHTWALPGLFYGNYIYCQFYHVATNLKRISELRPGNCLHLCLAKRSSMHQYTGTLSGLKQVDSSSKYN